MDYMDALLSGAPLEEDKYAAMADSLRGQKRAADIFSMSTLKPLAGAAQTESGNVMTSAKRGGVLREAARRSAEQKANRIEDNEYRDRALKQALTISREGRVSAENIAAAKAAKTGKSAFSSMPAAMQKQYLAADTIDAGFEDLIRRVDEEGEGAFGLLNNASTMAPDWTPKAILKPWKAMETGSKTDKEQQLQNDVFKNAYDIIHALAGATLAAGEEDKISKFAPMPEDSQSTIRNKLVSALAEARRSKGVMQNLSGGTIEVPGGDAVIDTPPPDDYDNMTDEQLDALLSGG